MLQQELIAGTTLNFLTVVPDFPASGGWTLKYYLVRRGGTGNIALTATPEGDDYRVQATAAATAAWTPDTYSWASRIEKAATSEKYEVNKGQIVVQPDIAAATGTFDNRTATQIAYDNVQAMLQGRASSATKRYRIGDRELESFSPAELITLRNHLSIDLQRERTQQALAEGRPDPRKVYVRLNRE